MGLTKAVERDNFDQLHVTEQSGRNEGPNKHATAILPFRHRTRKVRVGHLGGEPLGVSAKLWLTPTRSIDAGVGWSLISDDTNLKLHADFLWHNFDVLKVDNGSLTLYSGLGVRVRFWEDSRFGSRVPIISFVPETEVDRNVGRDLRFCFFE